MLYACKCVAKLALLGWKTGHTGGEQSGADYSVTEQGAKARLVARGIHRL